MNSASQDEAGRPKAGSSRQDMAVLLFWERAKNSDIVRLHGSVWADN